MLVDEADLWPDGQVRHDPPDRHAPSSSRSTPTSSRRSSGHGGGHRRHQRRRREAKRSSTTESRAITGKALDDEVDRRVPWKNLEFTLDPIASSLQKSADDAIDVGLLEPVDLEGIYDLRCSTRSSPTEAEVAVSRPLTSESNAIELDEHSPARRGEPVAVPLEPRSPSASARRRRVAALDDVDLDVGRRRVRLPARRLGLRQVDAAQPRRRARRADERARSRSTASAPR